MSSANSVHRFTCILQQLHAAVEVSSKGRRVLNEIMDSVRNGMHAFEALLRAEEGGLGAASLSLLYEAITRSIVPLCRARNEAYQYIITDWSKKVFSLNGSSLDRKQAMKNAKLCVSAQMQDMHRAAGALPAYLLQTPLSPQRQALLQRLQNVTCAKCSGSDAKAVRATAVAAVSDATVRRLQACEYITDRARIDASSALQAAGAIPVVVSLASQQDDPDLACAAGLALLELATHAVNHDDIRALGGCELIVRLAQSNVRHVARRAASALASLATVKANHQAIRSAGAIAVLIGAASRQLPEALCPPALEALHSLAVADYANEWAIARAGAIHLLLNIDSGPTRWYPTNPEEKSLPPRRRTKSPAAAEAWLPLTRGHGLQTLGTLSVHYKYGMLYTRLDWGLVDQDSWDLEECPCNTPFAWVQEDRQQQRAPRLSFSLVPRRRQSFTVEKTRRSFAVETTRRSFALEFPSFSIARRGLSALLDHRPTQPAAAAKAPAAPCAPAAPPVIRALRADASSSCGLATAGYCQPLELPPKDLAVLVDGSPSGSDRSFRIEASTFAGCSDSLQSQSSLEQSTSGESFVTGGESFAVGGDWRIFSRARASTEGVQVQAASWGSPAARVFVQHPHQLLADSLALRHVGVNA